MTWIFSDEFLLVGLMGLLCLHVASISGAARYSRYNKKHAIAMAVFYLLALLFVWWFKGHGAVLVPAFVGGYLATKTLLEHGQVIFYIGIMILFESVKCLVSGQFLALWKLSKQNVIDIYKSAATPPAVTALVLLVYAVALGGAS